MKKGDKAEEYIVGKFEYLLVNKGLYDSIDITIDDLAEMEDLFAGGCGRYTVDCFCMQCNEKRVFESVDKEVHEGHGVISSYIILDSTRAKKPKKEDDYNYFLNKRHCLSFQCTRDHKHLLLFDLLVTDKKIIKIGQYPPVSSISVGDIREYKSILNDYFIEYSTALRLFSQNIGIGSFAYLRRIIEKLVFEKYEEVKGKIDVSEQKFYGSEFTEKIKLLKDFLPKDLTDNHNSYGIVSKGIHELTEEECLKIFPKLIAGIELILDEILAEKKRIEKSKAFKTFVADTTGEFREADRQKKAQRDSKQ